MLFTVALIHYGAFRYLKSNTKILIGIVGFYVVGYRLNLELDILNPLQGRVIGWNYLFIHEAITMKDGKGSTERNGLCFVAVFLVALLFGQAAAAAESPRPAPPPSAGVWRRCAAAQRFDASGIFDYMDGAGELYLAYRFKQLKVYTYQAANRPDIVAEIYFMDSPADAFGLLSQDWEGEPMALPFKAEPAKNPARAPAARALYRNGLLRIASGAVFIRVAALQETPQTRQAVYAIGRAVVADRPHLDEPGLLSRLPLKIAPNWRLQPDQLRFLRSSLVLNTFYYVGLDNVFNLDLSDEAVTVPYELAKGRGKTTRIRLLLVKYADAAKADREPALFGDTFLKEHKVTAQSPAGQIHCFKVADGWMGYCRQDRFMAFIFQCPDAATVGRALAAVFAIR